MANDFYLDNVERLEPDIATVWGETGNAQSSQATALISAAISLKRIANNLEPVRPRQIALYVRGGGTHVFQQVNSSDSRNVYRGTFGEIILQDWPAT